MEKVIESCVCATTVKFLCDLVNNFLLPGYVD